MLIPHRYNARDNIFLFVFSSGCFPLLRLLGVTLLLLVEYCLFTFLHLHTMKKKKKDLANIL